MSDEKPFARVVPSDGRYYKVAGVIAKPSAPQDAEGDVRTINTAVAARERKAAAKALREIAVAFDVEMKNEDEAARKCRDLGPIGSTQIHESRRGAFLTASDMARSKAAAIERGAS